MWIRYSNNYSRGVWLAIGYYSPGCSDGGDWAKKGWWRLEPGQAATVLWTTNTYSTFYAEADDGAVWNGPYHTNLPIQAFDWCWNTASSTGQDVGMRLVSATNAWAPWTATINLT
jgi:Protein of unknown function (DUF1036)